MYKFHADAGHGWLAVKRFELVELGILENISHFSYQRGKTVYLEEDRDMGLFLKAKGYPAVKVEIKQPSSWPDRSPIRSYKSFEK
jgi:hypothetical protein